MLLSGSLFPRLIKEISVHVAWSIFWSCGCGSIYDLLTCGMGLRQPIQFTGLGNSYQMGWLQAKYSGLLDDQSPLFLHMFFVADGWEGGTKRKAERYGCGQELRTAHCHCCSGGSNKRQLQEKRNRSLLLPDNPSHSTIFWWMEPGLLQNYAAKSNTELSECGFWMSQFHKFSRWPTEEQVVDWYVTAVCLGFPICKMQRAPSSTLWW